MNVVANVCGGSVDACAGNMAVSRCLTSSSEPTPITSFAVVVSCVPLRRACEVAAEARRCELRLSGMQRLQGISLAASAPLPAVLNQSNMITRSSATAVRATELSELPLRSFALDKAELTLTSMSGQPADISLPPEYTGSEAGMSRAGGGDGEATPTSQDTYRVHLLLKNASLGLGADTEAAACTNSVPQSATSAVISSGSAAATGRTTMTPIVGDLTEPGRCVSEAVASVQPRQVIQVTIRWAQFVQLFRFISSVVPKFVSTLTLAANEEALVAELCDAQTSYVHDSSAFTAGAANTVNSSGDNRAAAQRGTQINAASAAAINDERRAGIEAPTVSNASMHGARGFQPSLCTSEPPVVPVPGVLAGQLGICSAQLFGGSSPEEEVVSNAQRHIRCSLMQSYLNKAIETPSVNCLLELQSFIGYTAFVRNQRAQLAVMAQPASFAATLTAVGQSTRRGVAVGAQREGHAAAAVRRHGNRSTTDTVSRSSSVTSSYTSSSEVNHPHPQRTRRGPRAAVADAAPTCALAASSPSVLLTSTAAEAGRGGSEGVAGSGAMRWAGRSAAALGSGACSVPIAAHRTDVVARVRYGGRVKDGRYVAEGKGTAVRTGLSEGQRANGTHTTPTSAQLSVDYLSDDNASNPTSGSRSHRSLSEHAPHSHHRQSPKLSRISWRRTTSRPVRRQQRKRRHHHHHRNVSHTANASARGVRASSGRASRGATAKPAAVSYDRRHTERTRCSMDGKQPTYRAHRDPRYKTTSQMITPPPLTAHSLPGCTQKLNSNEGTTLVHDDNTGGAYYNHTDHDTRQTQQELLSHDTKGMQVRRDNTLRLAAELSVSRDELGALSPRPAAAEAPSTAATGVTTGTTNPPNAKGCKPGC